MNEPHAWAWHNDPEVIITNKAKLRRLEGGDSSARGYTMPLFKWEGDTPPGMKPTAWVASRPNESPCHFSSLNGWDVQAVMFEKI